MTAIAEPISLTRLSLAMIPVVILLFWLASGGRPLRTTIAALGRMLLQLLLVGYALVFLFDAPHPAITITALTVMLLAASAIALRTATPKSWTTYLQILLAIFLGGGGTLAVMSVGVLNLQPWYQPRVLIPLAGMTFSNCLNVISLALSQMDPSSQQPLDSEHRTGIGQVGSAVEKLAAEKLAAEESLGSRQVRDAVDVAMIPITNSLMAVGVVSIPGMMTGQVLAGVSPLIAARYQIMIMCMVFASAGLSLMIFLRLRHRFGV